MKVRAGFLVVVGLCVLMAGQGWAQVGKPAGAKHVDPAYGQIKDEPGLPRVLLIGDSVSVGYTLAVRKELAGKANVHRPRSNCGTTKIGLRDLDGWLGAGKWDVIHFNFGLHDLGYRFTDESNVDAKGNYARPDNGGHQNVPPEQYEKNLRDLVARLKKTGAKLIFATTTPVPADLHSYVKGAELPYNEAAKRVMGEAGIAINDLWALATPQLEKIQERGNPHFTSKGSVVLAKQIAGAIETALGGGGGNYGVESPDGTIKVIVRLEEGRPYWDVTIDGGKVIEKGLLGVQLASENWSGAFEIAGVEKASGDSTWRPVWGNLSEVRDRYNELTVRVQESGGAKRMFNVVLRAYDEGVACRYAFPAQAAMERVAIKSRLTEYRFGENRTIYQNRKYEYGTVGIDAMSKSEGNVTVDVGGGKFVSLTDADRADFSQVSWVKQKGSSGVIVGELHSQASGTTPFQTSWEVMIVGKSAGKLYENRYIVENLNPPCAIADTSWIRPGKAICQVRNTRMVTDELKKLLDFASAHHIEYVEIDHSWSGAETKWTEKEIEFFDQNKSKFWNDKPEWKRNVGGNPMAAAKGWVPFRPKADGGGNYVDLDVPALAAYGNALTPKVGVCLYVRGAVLKEFGGDHPIDEVFATYERWGVAGVKPGFVPSASQQSERTVAYMVEKAAEHKLIAVIHDSYYPSGLSRTYPNLMNIEGVAGEEAEPVIDAKIKSLHDVMLPFTRCLMGPVDYTPEVYKTSKTHCHQVAMLGVYHGRPSIRGGMRQWSPGGVGGGEIEFVEKLPGLFDEMKVFTEIGQYVTVARRRGDAWYVASMSNSNGRRCDLPLGFLKAGVAYTASIYSDVPGSLDAAHSQQAVTAASVVSINMEPNGGHLMIIEPAKRGEGTNP